MQADPLTAFLYLLMRDHVPTGTVKQLVAEVSSDEGFDLSAPELAALAERYSAPLRDVIDAGVVEDDDEEEREPRVGIVIAQGDVLLDEEGDEFEPSHPMASWLDLFDDRIRTLPTFVQAVNEAAENDRPANEDTARIVAARARELAEAKGS
jgi:hypothetical protein